MKSKREERHREVSRKRATREKEQKNLVNDWVKETERCSALSVKREGKKEEESWVLTAFDERHEQHTAIPA